MSTVSTLDEAYAGLDALALTDAEREVADAIRDSDSPSDNGGEYEALRTQIQRVEREEIRPHLFELLRIKTIWGPR